MKTQKEPWRKKTYEKVTLNYQSDFIYKDADEALDSVINFYKSKKRPYGIFLKLIFYLSTLIKRTNNTHVR
jgi:hypothetical protein